MAPTGAGVRKQKVLLPKLTKTGKEDLVGSDSSNGKEDEMEGSQEEDNSEGSSSDSSSTSSKRRNEWVEKERKRKKKKKRKKEEERKKRGATTEAATGGPETAELKPAGAVITLGPDPIRNARTIRDLVRRELFRCLKFISKDSQLAITAGAADYVAAELGLTVEEPIFARLWEDQRRNIKRALDSKRSTTSMNIKNVVIRKCAIRGGGGILVTKTNSCTFFLHSFLTRHD